MLKTFNKKLQLVPITVTSSCVRKKDELHFHDFTQIWYMLSGTLKHSFSDKTYVQTPGHCVVVLPFTKHSIDTTDSEDTPITVNISFTDAFLTERGYRFFSYSRGDARFEERTIPSICEFTGTNREIADMLARRMLSEFSRQRDMDFDLLAELLTEFLRILCREQRDDTDMLLAKERADAISNAVNYISEHLSEKITIDSLCSVSAMSRSVFTRSFKIVTGMTVAEFITEMRIYMIRSKLLFSDKSLNEIAQEVGFFDKSHLSRIFKKHSGFTPLQFREKERPAAIQRDIAYKKRWAWLNNE